MGDTPSSGHIYQTTQVLDNSELIQLIDKYLNGTASQLEEQMLVNFFDSYQEEKAWDETVLGPKPAMEQKLLAKIHQRLGKEKPAPRILLYRKFAAAAILILMLSGAAYLYLRSPGKRTEIAQVKPFKDIAPASGKAILTLSDGKEVLLDDVAAGKVSAGAIKTGNGKLEYRNTDQNMELSAATVYNTLTTPRGGQHYIRLADGTQAWLNAASSISFPVAFTGGGPRIVKITGEVYFEVAKDASRPFHVQYGDVDIQVLGTHFNVNAYSDEIFSKTTLLEGAVNISRAGQHLLLQPGQQAEAGSTTFSKNPNPDLEEVMAWRNGIFQLAGADVAEIMRQISRWYDIDIVYQGTVPQGHLVGDIPRTMTLSNVLEGLKLSGIHTKVEAGKIIVLP